MWFILISYHFFIDSTNSIQNDPFSGCLHSIKTEYFLESNKDDKLLISSSREHKEQIEKTGIPQE